MWKEILLLATTLAPLPVTLSSSAAETRHDTTQDPDSPGFSIELANAIRQVFRDGKKAARSTLEQMVRDNPQDLDIWAALYTLYWHDPPRSEALHNAATEAGEDVLALYSQVFVPNVYKDNHNEQIVRNLRHRFDTLPAALRARPLIRSLACYLFSGIAPEKARQDCEAAALNAPDMMSTIRGTAIVQEQLNHTIPLRGLAHRILVMYNADLASVMHFWDSRPRCAAAAEHLSPFLKLDFRHPLRLRALRALLSGDSQLTAETARKLLWQLDPEDPWWRGELQAVVDALGDMPGMKQQLEDWLQRAANDALASASTDGGSFLSNVALVLSKRYEDMGNLEDSSHILRQAVGTVRNAYRPNLMRRLAKLDDRERRKWLTDASLLEHPFLGTIPIPSECLVPEAGNVQRTLALASTVAERGLTNIDGQVHSFDKSHVLVLWRGRCHWTKVLHDDLVEQNGGREVDGVYWVNFDDSSTAENVSLTAGTLGLPAASLLLSRQNEAEQNPLHLELGVSASPYLIAVTKSGLAVWEHRGVEPGGTTALEILRLLEYLDELD